MLVDLSFKNLFSVKQNENKVNFYYNDNKVIVLTFNSNKEAEEFYNQKEFLNENRLYYSETANAVCVKDMLITGW